MKEKKILEEIARFRKISKIDNGETINEGSFGDLLKNILFGSEDLSWDEILNKFFEKVNEKKTSQTENVDFDEITKMIIDKIEGGYYNPLWHFKSGMGRSGETMFGIDRLHGGKLNTSGYGTQFWNIIDKNKKPEIWKHGYRGGDLQEELTNLVIQIMKPHYEDLRQKYLSEDSKKIIDTDKVLTFNFIYASWNGSGIFQKLANEFNQAVEDGITDIDELREVAIESRKNHTPGWASSKVERIMNDLSNGTIS